MENITSLINRLSKEKRIIVRSPQVISWGSREHCEKIFREIFQRVDGSIRQYHHLPEYARVIDWMTGTQGRGLLLMGDCGRGKSIISTGVVPVLLAMKNCHAVPVHADDFCKSYPFAASTAGCDPKMTNLDYLAWTQFPIIDELGVESLVNNYGEKSEGFNRVINAAERYLRPLFISTNLTKEELLGRYGERTFDRLSHLCQIVKFNGESLR
ncbi:MAG: hypothetical protein V8Q45_12660 [Alistipes onderdonkii]|nr:MAG TPA: replicative helicase [Caudoviricetes sp.]